MSVSGDVQPRRDWRGGEYPYSREQTRNQPIPVFGIRHLFCAHIGCRGTQNDAPGDFSMRTGLYNKCVGKGALTGCTGIKMCAPTAKLCTPSKGCTLNFEHCIHCDQKRKIN